MEIRCLGHSCFQVKTKEVKVVFDPFNPALIGLPLKEIEADVVLVSHGHEDHNFLKAVGGSPFVVAGPGEYDVKGVKIIGLKSYHDGNMGKERGKNTIYNVEIESVSFAHLGDLGEKLNERSLSEIGKVDVLFVPVGGVFTIDATQAAEVVSQLEPQIVIPMHYFHEKKRGAFAGLSTLESFVKTMGEPLRHEKILKLTRDDLVAEGIQLIVLEPSP